VSPAGSDARHKKNRTSMTQGGRGLSKKTDCMGGRKHGNQFILNQKRGLQARKRFLARRDPQGRSAARKGKAPRPHKLLGKEAERKEQEEGLLGGTRLTDSGGRKKGSVILLKKREGTSLGTEKRSRVGKTDMLTRRGRLGRGRI